MQGQHYLREQLDSIVGQTRTNWYIWVSDDGSSDDTHAILSEYQQRLGASRMVVHAGPAEGFVTNFLTLACKASITADYYAFADQDDIWEPDKLEQALLWLQTVPDHLPALYCGRTLSVDTDNCEMGFSPLFSKPPCFSNALVQSIAGGNTMMFNNASRRFLRKAGPEIKVVSHDWWAYMVVAGCGGRIFYDPTPKVRYRQHANNLVGTSRGIAATLDRVRAMLVGRFKSWNDVNMAALITMRPYLTPENKVALDTFVQARRSGLLQRLWGLHRSGVHRQTLVGNTALWVAGLLNKI